MAEAFFAITDGLPFTPPSLLARDGGVKGIWGVEGGFMAQ